MATRTIQMPQLGESVVEGTVGQWLVKVGDHVSAGDPLVEIETDKTNTEVPALEDGYVHELLVEEGDTVDVGTDIVVLGDSPKGGASNGEQKKNSAPKEAPVKEEPKAEAKEDKQETPAKQESKPAPAKKSAVQESNDDQRRAQQPVMNGPGGGRPVGQFKGGNGPAILGGAAPQSQARPSAAPQAAAAPAQPQVAPAGGVYGAPAQGKYFRAPAVEAGPDDTVVKFSRRRGIIAEHMVYSKQVSPHVYTMAEVDMTAVMESRRANKNRVKEQGVNLTVFSYILAATAKALRETPEINAVVGDGEIIQRGHVHLGIAVETDGGLVVPVIRDADSLSVIGIAKKVTELADKARDKKITVDDLSGGTFTVSNPGRQGNLIGFAVINQPQAGIVRMGEIVRRPVVRKLEGQEAIVIRDVMMLSLSYDHRLIDGAKANGFLFRIAELLTAGKFEL